MLSAQRAAASTNAHKIRPALRPNRSAALHWCGTVFPHTTNGAPAITARNSAWKGPDDSIPRARPSTTRTSLYNKHVSLPSQLTARAGTASPTSAVNDTNKNQHAAGNDAGTGAHDADLSPHRVTLHGFDRSARAAQGTAARNEGARRRMHVSPLEIPQARHRHRTGKGRTAPLSSPSRGCTCRFQQDQFPWTRPGFPGNFNAAGAGFRVLAQNRHSAPGSSRNFWLSRKFPKFCSRSSVGCRKWRFSAKSHPRHAPNFVEAVCGR